MKAIIDFLKNEHGNHVLEYTGTCIVIAGGTVGAIKTVKDGMVGKLGDLTAATDVDSSGDIGG